MKAKVTMKTLGNTALGRHLGFLGLGKLLNGLLLGSLLLLTQVSRAESISWLADPVDNNWNNPANWSSGRVPNGLDEVLLGISTIRNLSITEPASVADLVFETDAQAYIITAQPGAGLGFSYDIFNDSAFVQNFVAASDGETSAYFSLNDDTTSDNTIIGAVTFTQHARNGSNSEAPPLIQFVFYDAGDATIHNLGAIVPGGVGGLTSFFYGRASAETCTIINDGATVAGAAGGHTDFPINSPDAGNATITAQEGTNGGRRPDNLSGQLFGGECDSHS